jgi:hypothetical protein
MLSEICTALGRKEIMQLRIWKRIYLSPFVRLNLFTISFGHREIGWITFGLHGVKETLDTPLPGVYLITMETMSMNRTTKIPI